MDIAKLIKDRAKSEVFSCAPHTSVREAVALLAGRRIGAIPVMEGARVVGVFSERDVLYRLAGDGESFLGRAVGEVMTAPPITVDPRTTLLDALALMTERRIRHLPVVAGDELCGFISIGDLVKARLEEIQYEAEAMRNYIQTA